jgi:hypothetical protein
MTNGGTREFEDRVAQIEAVAAAVAKFENPDLQAAAFNYLLRGVTTPVLGPEENALDGEVIDETIPDEGNGEQGGADGERRGAGTRKRAATKKQTLTFDKSLNFYSTDGELGVNLKGFAEAHPAKNTVQKSVVVVYWLAKELGLSPLSVDHVYSAFKTLGWPIPASLLNTLQKAGTENFLDTKKSADIKLTTHGENLVEFQIIPKADS